MIEQWFYGEITSGQRTDLKSILVSGFRQWDNIFSKYLSVNNTVVS